MPDDRNGGSGEYAAPTTLEQVVARLRSRLEGPDPEPPSDEESWRFTAMQNRETLRHVQEDLLAIAISATDAAKSNADISSDLKRLLDASLPIILERWPIVDAQVRALTTKVAVVENMLDRVDDAQVHTVGVVNLMRRELHDVRIDVERVKEHTELLPAIKSLLGDIIARLPEKA